VSETLGQRLRTLRKERGLRLLDVAEAAVISVSYLNDLEHDRTNPSLKALARIAAALDLSAIQVLTGISPYDPPDDT
jgi:XRE family transcriptional regulator, regulator of sulfur utilization